MKQTYVAFDGVKYKIGQSVNPEKRIESCRTANPNIKLLIHGFGIGEKKLHERFKSKRISREWFNLDKEDISYISKKLIINPEMKETNKKTPPTKNCPYKALEKHKRENKLTWNVYGEIVGKEEGTIRAAFRKQSLTSLELDALIEFINPIPTTKKSTPEQLIEYIEINKHELMENINFKSYMENLGYSLVIKKANITFNK